MRKVLIWALPCLLAASALSATDKTYELLRAPHVKYVLRVQLTQGKALEFADDDRPNFRTLSDASVFVISDQADLVYRDFNPFRVSISVDQKAEPDPNFGSIVKLLDATATAVGNLGSPIPGAAPTAAMGSPAPTPSVAPRDAVDRLAEISQGLGSITGNSAGIPSFQAQNQMTTPEALSWLEESLDVMSGELTKDQTNEQLCGVFDNQLKVLQSLIDSPVVSVGDFKLWESSSTDATGVASVRERITEKTAFITQQQVQVTDILKEISRISRIQNGPICRNISVSSFALAIDVTRRINEVVSRRERLKADLVKLNKYLEKFEDRTTWREGPLSDYIFFKPTADFQNSRELSVAVVSRKLTSGNEGFEIQEEPPVKRTIRIRKYSLLVPEASAGPIYTDLSFPKYGTRVEGGQTLVTRLKDEKYPAQAAVLLNISFRLPVDSFIYPGLQIGMSTAKDYPGLLLGIHSRFTFPRALSIGYGWLFTRHKDLGTLRVDSPVASQAAIDADLTSKTAPTAHYLTVQLSF